MLIEELVMGLDCECLRIEWGHVETEGYSDWGWEINIISFPFWIYRA